MHKRKYDRLINDLKTYKRSVIKKKETLPKLLVIHKLKVLKKLYNQDGKLCYGMINNRNVIPIQYIYTYCVLLISQIFEDFDYSFTT